MKKAMAYGILASFFFAFTFLLNRSMNLSGGYWMWSAALRYLFMLPMLAALLLAMPGNRLGRILQEISRHPAQWILWSTVGFGLFYLPLTMASLYGSSWLTAACWQITIVAGVLLTPLFGGKIPGKNIAMSLVILLGIFLLQVPNFSEGTGSLFALVPILVAAFAYPLGNRKMMALCPGETDTLQRVFGMTLCSLPFWLVVSALALIRSGLPSPGQVGQSAGVAFFSGVLATLLFFHATDLVRANQKQLAAVEATQCGEVLFTLLGGILVLQDQWPPLLGGVGLGLIVVGMVGNALAGSK